MTESSKSIVYILSSIDNVGGSVNKLGLLQKNNELTVLTMPLIEHHSLCEDDNFQSKTEEFNFLSLTVW